MVHFVIQWDLPDQKANLLGCRNFTVNVWAPSKYFPESMRP